MRPIPFILFGIFLSSSFLSCERELTPREDLEFRKKPSHCYNNRYDKGELAVDCGGSCGACEDADPSCDPRENKARYVDGSQLGGTSTYSIDNITCDLGPNDALKATCTFNNDTLKVFPDTVDTQVSTTVNCDYTTGNINSNAEAYYGGKQLCNTTIYIGVEEGKRYIALCGGVIDHTGFGSKDDTLKYARIDCSI